MAIPVIGLGKQDYGETSTQGYLIPEFMASYRCNRNQPSIRQQPSVDYDLAAVIRLRSCWEIAMVVWHGNLRNLLRNTGISAQIPAQTIANS